MLCLLARKRRPHHTRFVPYREKQTPTEPNASAVHILQQKRVSPATVDQIRKAWDFCSYLVASFCNICDVQQSGHQTCDQAVAGFTPSCCLLAYITLWTPFSIIWAHFTVHRFILFICVYFVCFCFILHSCVIVSTVGCT